MALPLRRVENQESLLSLKEAAQMLGMAPTSLKRWVQLRKIGHVRVGQMIRFRRSQLEAYIAAHTVPRDEDEDV
jgi:excisionase family DNA binding protein